ncbi:MAG: peptide ABC transporter substrate-binding protein [Candidatus Dadabacteria bacterium]|nr:peptide ABC transporter substrate-binding protein [Candidatus Dadabacteria bacterium]
MKYKKTFLVLAMIVAGLFITSCGDDDDDETLTILYWQAPTSVNPYLTGGIKDVDASALILEPLANYDEEGRLVPRLAEEIPTVENGGVSEDMTTITWKLKEGILWSDGTPLTVEDVIFTHRYLCSLPSTESLCGPVPIGNVDPVEDFPLSIRVTFTEPVIYPYTLFVGASSPILQKAQFANCVGESVEECHMEHLYPVGTGPYKITDFTISESDAGTISVLTYEINEHFRTTDKLFPEVIIKGGGNAVTAARAVLERGEADYAWNLQIDPQTLGSLQEVGKGTVRPAFASLVEYLVINFTNPDPDLGDRRSEWSDGNNPHPFLTDPAVRRALSLAIDRRHIVEQLYGIGGRTTCNIIPAPSQYASPNNEACLTQDIEEARTLLNKAGWIPGDDGIREKNGVRLKILYQTSTNSVRQTTQELIQGWWRDIGVQTELKNIDAGIFFSGDSDDDNPDNLWRFYADIQMYAGEASIDPQSDLSGWLTTEITGSENDWSGGNVPRWSNQEYDDLYQELTQTPIGPDRESLVIRMNDMLIQNHVVIPLVDRAFVSAFSNSLKGVRINGWDSKLWNIHEWYRE